MTHQRSGPTWSLSWRCHGKGAPDGIGGTLKWSADRIVRLGEDVPDAFTLFQKLWGLESTVELFFVSEDPCADSVEGTMRMHQDDDDVYPGIIMDVETHSIPVKCMHRNGVNKYFWTTPREDVSCFPMNSTSGHPSYQDYPNGTECVDNHIWDWIHTVQPYYILAGHPGQPVCPAGVLPAQDVVHGG
ncbi:hypothetical protein NHX12_019809 [Muraenolepis orangiensis]|uniref:Uncharacterized protein n=1 Tax=Muraenolepis orangiensis TaxID=630683 RepID=A0A9Q0EZ32_9TELE|nr:hypothetical protein NHX12_019809 [Muraenolepis orangiensis]